MCPLHSKWGSSFDSASSCVAALCVEGEVVLAGRRPPLLLPAIRQHSHTAVQRGVGDGDRPLSASENTTVYGGAFEHIVLDRGCCTIYK